MSQNEAIGRVKAGDWVQVKAWEEIAETLDADGTTDGLPFMPEMIEFCGGRYQVRRYAEQTCVEMPGGHYVVRTFDKKDIVLLDDLRCSGLHHDGCQRLCSLFWKSCWVQLCSKEASVNLGRLPVTSHSLKVKQSPTKYFCQSTQIVAVSRDHKPSDTISQITTDLRTRAVGFFTMIWLIVLPIVRKMRNKVFGRPRLRGSLTRTPVQHLGLEQGDLVQIKSRQEIQATLDQAGRNRGLSCDVELLPHCGQQFKVRGRLDRMISEATGEMRTVTATVMLDGVPCPCSFSVGGCPRSDIAYFREIWLNKIDGEQEAVR